MSNNYITKSKCGYNIRNSDGDISLRKFINSFDYCLDLIKLREIYEKVYRRKNFSFWVNKKEYTQRVINVTFKYSYKEYNRIRNGLYIKAGYSIDDIDLKDNVYVKDNELIAIQTYEPLNKGDKRKKKYNIEEWKLQFIVSSSLSDELLGKCFFYEDGVYKAKSNIKAIHTVAELRELLYENGFVCDGIKYVRWKRSSGSARVGKCLFIDERLYRQIHQWEMCGLNIRKGQTIDLAAWESYISLTLSSIIDTVEIKPENILVINDFKSVFKEKIMATKLIDGRLVTEPEETQISNDIWDGQSLLDVSVFGKYSQYGMILLRNRFFKSACFNTNIQKWFKDNGITSITQLNGVTKANKIEDIKFITTSNSVKYLKFSSLDDWLRTLDSTFGIVKHEKPTYFWSGRMVQAHYQLINTLQLTEEEVGNLLSQSFDYITKLKTDANVFRYHIGYQTQEYFDFKPLLTQNDIVYKFLGLNNKFSETQLYDKFRKTLIDAYIKNLRKGHVLIRGNYSTLLGNPIEMLEESIGKFNGASKLGVGNIHCTNFSSGETILGSRSPHVNAGNVWLSKNIISRQIQEYFNLTKEIVCVNSIRENVLERLSGADYDSDSVLLTNNTVLVNSAKRNYDKFLVPTKLVESIPQKHKYIPKDLAQLDIKTSVNKIGEIINLGQELNSKIWDKINNGASFDDVLELYKDTSQLDVMSNLEIDSAKRENPADNTWELKKIKKKYTERDKKGRYIRPIFFKYLDKEKGFYDNKRKTYRLHKTAMDFLQIHIDRFRLPYKADRGTYCSFVDILKRPEIDEEVYRTQAIRIIDMLRSAKLDISKVWQRNDGISNSEKYIQSQEIKNVCISKISNITLNESTMFYLLRLCDNQNYSDVSSLLFSILFSVPNKSFWDLVIKSKNNIPVLIEHVSGDIQLYDFNFCTNLQF